MVEWKSKHKIALAGLGVSVLIFLLGIFSEYLRQHPIYAWIMGFIGIGMILLPVGHTIVMHFKKSRHPSVDVSPLEVIFEPLNPARRFWSLESHFDDNGKLLGTFWEHRIEIRNNSTVTLRNVVVMMECTGSMPQKPEKATFTRTKTDSCDINPRCSELVRVTRWSVNKSQVGFLTGKAAWGYGPIEIVASADNVIPVKAVFDFNYQSDQMLFERGKYDA